MNEGNLPFYIESQKEMKDLCLRMCTNMCTRYLVQNNNNYFKFFCRDSGCSFQITYNLRDSQKSKRGYYQVVKGTCLLHKPNCPYSRESNNHANEEPKDLAQQVVRLFQDDNPKLSTVTAFLEKITGRGFTPEQAKYIKKLAKGIHFNHLKHPISQMVDFCQELQRNQNWKFDMEFYEGTLSAIILFPPWAENMIRYYCDPLITDATFSTDQLRFLSAVVVDGLWKTQLVGLVIRATEDSQGYAYLFKFAAQILPREHFFTIMSDMAKCINSAASKCFRFYQLNYCHYHMKENLLKMLGYVPTTNAFNMLAEFMQGKISYEEFYEGWTDEESQFSGTLEGWTWLCKKAPHFAPNPKTRKLGIVSSQRSESLHSHVKHKSTNAIDMLKRYVSISTRWFQESAAMASVQRNILTDYAEDLLKENIQEEFKLPENGGAHFPSTETRCACCFGSDMGIPCPYTIRLIRVSLGENTDSLMDKIYAEVDKRWLSKTFKKAFTPFLAPHPQNPTYVVTNQNHSRHCPTSKDWDILGAKCNWLIQNDPNFRAQLQALIEEKENEIVIPFVQTLRPKPKKKQRRRHLSSLEANALKKKHGEVIELLSKHLHGVKITKAKLLVLYMQIQSKNPNLPFLSSKFTKNDIIHFFSKHFDQIAPFLGSVPCLAPNGMEVTEDEEELILEE